MSNRRKWMAEKRKERKLSQEKLADMCKVTPQHISHIEIGIRNPSGELAKKISIVLDFDMSHFY